MNKKSNRFSPEVRERAVRIVQEHRGDYSSLWASIESIAPKVGCVPPTLLEWVKKAEVDSGVREGATSAEREQLKALERENRELLLDVNYPDTPAKVIVVKQIAPSQ